MESYKEGALKEIYQELLIISSKKGRSLKDLLIQAYEWARCFVIIPGEEDFSDTDSMKTGVDSPELVDSVPDKDNLRYSSQLKIKVLNSYYYSVYM